MRITSSKSAVVLFVAAGIVLSGCSPEDEEQEAPTPDEDSHEVSDFSFPEISDVEDYCSAAETLADVEQETRNFSEDQALTHFGDSLEFMSDAYLALAEHAGEPAEAEQWETVGEAYGQASDFFVSTGQQVANSDLITYLALAVAAANEAIEENAEAVEGECGVDLSSLQVEERE